MLYKVITQSQQEQMKSLVIYNLILFNARLAKRPLFLNQIIFFVLNSSLFSLFSSIQVFSYTLLFVTSQTPNASIVGSVNRITVTERIKAPFLV